MNAARRKKKTSPEERRPFPFRVHAPQLNAIIAVVLTSAAAAAMMAFHITWPWILAAGFAITAIATVLFKDAGLLQWIGVWFRWFRSHKTNPALAGPIDDVLDIEMPDGEGFAGVRWDGNYLVAIVALWPQPHTPTVISEGRPATIDTVPLSVIADGLWQNEISLSGIDVVAVGRRTSGDTAYAALYDQIVGLEPATTAQRTWLVLRMPFDPGSDAVLHRGGGIEGANRAIVYAARRLARSLRENNCLATVASKAEFRTAHTALATGLTHAQDQEEVDIQRGTIGGAAGHVTTYRMRPQDLTNENLSIWWSYRSPATTTVTRATTTTTVLRIEPRNGAGRPDRRVEVRAWIRHITAEAPGAHDRLPRLIRQYGDQYDAFVTTMPFGAKSLAAQSRMVLSKAALLQPSELDFLRIPVGPSGQLVGRNQLGHNYFLPFAQAGKVTRIYIKASLRVAQQQLLRSLAGGSTCRIVSNRPEQWYPMLRRLSEPNRLWLHPDPSARIASVHVCDGVPVNYPPGLVTLIMIETGSPADADIVIWEDAHGRVTVTSGHETVVDEKGNLVVRPNRPEPITLYGAREESRYLVS
ncbi:type VII secretion protein EccE [Mycobacteroides chelonae]|uniref:type VII secretion protein EccE n=1 Tax=Mycobacteroides chelonae TaxID=1774 RepID=UPI000AED1E9C|nr:type VII secretion protein EccE [Mycobacteroides chelonae]